jgi:hypothetical protein
MVSSCLGPAPNPTQNERGYYVEILSRVVQRRQYFKNGVLFIIACVSADREHSTWLLPPEGGVVPHRELRNEKAPTNKLRCVLVYSCGPS